MSDNESTSERKPREREKISVDETERIPEKKAQKKRFAVDRAKICPFLVRIYCRNGAHHPIDSFSSERIPKEDELQIYCWRDTTLRELSDLIARKFTKARERYVKLSFRIVFQDVRGGLYSGKEIGQLSNYRRSFDEQRTLEEARFYIGDFIDVAIFEDSPERFRERESVHSRLGAKRMSRDSFDDRNYRNSYEERGFRGDRKRSFDDENRFFARYTRDDKRARDENRGSRFNSESSGRLSRNIDEFEHPKSAMRSDYL